MCQTKRAYTIVYLDVKGPKHVIKAFCWGFMNPVELLLTHDKSDISLAATMFSHWHVSAI